MAKLGHRSHILNSKAHNFQVHQCYFVPVPTLDIGQVISRLRSACSQSKCPRNILCFNKFSGYVNADTSSMHCRGLRIVGLLSILLFKLFYDIVDRNQNLTLRITLNLRSADRNR